MRRLGVLAALVLALPGCSRFAVLDHARGGSDTIIHITARKFEYNPSAITVKRDVPVVLELTSLDREHGFKLPAFSVRADVEPGQVTRIRLVPHMTGRFPFACDVFCGGGHDDMEGELIVVD